MATKIQSLKEFQANFAAQPVEVNLSEFARDGAFSDVTVFLKPLTSRDRDNFEASVVGMDGHRDLANLRARLVSLCWVSEDGKRIGSEDDVGELRADFVGAMFDAVRRMNGMDSDDIEEAGKG